LYPVKKDDSSLGYFVKHLEKLQINFITLSKKGIELYLAFIKGYSTALK
jgi:hypothetical protein